MKAYKVFNHDWTCRGFQYEVGKTYKMPEQQLNYCFRGFHACRNLSDCFDYYEISPYNKIAEVKLSGKIMGINNSKQCASEITIIREIPFSDRFLVLDRDEFVEDTVKNITNSSGCYNSKGIVSSLGICNTDNVIRSNGINNSNLITGSRGINASIYISKCCGVHSSKSISKSDGVSDSQAISCSFGIANSSGIYFSEGVIVSECVMGSLGISSSTDINKSYGISISSAVVKSNGINNSIGIKSSVAINNSFAVVDSQGIHDSMFVSEIERKPLLFNKPVSSSRLDEVRLKLKQKLNGWVPEYNNIKHLYLKAGCSWEKTPIKESKTTEKQAWKNMPIEAIKYLMSLPEFDAEIFFKITGIDVNARNNSVKES